ncbi:heavy metal response regulator transcription factor [Duganella levis]|jgi:two-component system copper resistance phosphate regulon response regulator CusR|uniref:Heavy metal response regulator transcription factor n=1 Tax=Duganella levis TaxID=2692169 RepID=A0ABW9VTX5_9BURK|nr:heavy metal response regulator transcription factor [Duganella levis]MYN25083.1 heavy metal response regulator transcription factor [Duganella levis]
MRILIVEDETKTGDYLRKGLLEAGFQADLARTGPGGLDLALHEDYALIVLDVMLPGLDGWSVLRQLRERKQTPVLMLTARDEVADRVRGLELGADDYLIKPFAFAELLARLRTLLRRAPPRPRDTLNVADLCIEVQRRRVSRGDVRIDLTVQDFALLQLLAEREGDVLSRSLIASHVWDMNFESDTNVVDVAIRRLRAKIDDPYPVKLVHTVRGMGYVLEARA